MCEFARGDGGGVHGRVLAHECNGGGIQVVSLLSSGGGGDVEYFSIRQHLALGGVQAEGRGNLDSPAGCGIMRLEHLFHL